MKKVTDALLFPHSPPLFVSFFPPLPMEAQSRWTLYLLFILCVCLPIMHVRRNEENCENKLLFLDIVVLDCMFENVVKWEANEQLITDA